MDVVPSPVLKVLSISQGLHLYLAMIHAELHLTGKNDMEPVLYRRKYYFSHQTGKPEKDHWNQHKHFTKMLHLSYDQ